MRRAEAGNLTIAQAAGCPACFDLDTELLAWKAYEAVYGPLGSLGADVRQAATTLAVRVFAWGMGGGKGKAPTLEECMVSSIARGPATDAELESKEREARAAMRAAALRLQAACAAEDARKKGGGGGKHVRKRGGGL